MDRILQPMTVYDWQPMRDYCEQMGLTFLEDWVPQADQEFYEAGLSQVQAEAMFRSYAWRVNHLFKPSTWTFKQRIGLAWQFIFG